MPTRSQSIELFNKNIDELISSNYILSEKKLTILMKGLSVSKMFFELFEYCLDNFDYALEKKACFLAGASWGKGSVKLPTDSKKIIAFCFSLLYEIDSKRVDFISILEQYFHRDTYNESYACFAQKILVPFKNEVLRAVNAMTKGAESKPDAKDSVPVVKALSDMAAKQVKDLLDQSKSVILQYKMEPDIKAELMILYNNFQDALFEAEAEKLKIAFLAYKYTTLYHRKLDVSVEKIQKILAENGIV